MDKSLTERIGLYLESLPPPTGRTFHQMQPETSLSECRTMIDLQAGVIINYQNRIADLEKALRKIISNNPVRGDAGLASIKDIVDAIIRSSTIARAALGEKKDG